MMLLADLVFARQAWLPWAWGFGAILLILSLLSYRKSAMPLQMRCLALLLRSLGIGLLLFAWLEPMASREQPKPQANSLLVAVDNSNSMKALVSNSDEEAFRSLIADDASWLVNATETYRVRKYFFDSEVIPTDSLTSWTGEGSSSSLDRSLKNLATRYRDQPVAGIILVTDGRSTDPADAMKRQLVRETGGQIPIFPVRIGALRTLRDLKIDSVSVLQSEFETAPVTMTAEVSHVGFSGEEAEVELKDTAGKTIDSKKVPLSADRPTAKVEFRFRPEQSGVTAYELVVKPSDPNSLDSKPEITQSNNRRFQVVDRGMGPYRILYLAGRPNWEYKFLRRALDEDAELSLTSLIRIANREMKFSFRNSKMDSTNPLFSGFEDVSDDEKQQYDEPVYARLGVRNSGELQKGFPKDAEELFEYSALIIDDLEHQFLTLNQQQLIRQFVAVRGGALLALGGQESMRGTEFRDSVLGQILPLYGDSSPVSTSVPELFQESPEKLRFQLTREGWLQPPMRLADNETAERKRLEAMPEFQVFNRTSRLKPGASIWIEGEVGEGERIPVYISQRFGRGKSAAFMLGDFWRWGLKYEGEDRSPVYQAWRQMVRSAIADVPKPISIDPSISDDNPRLARILVHVAGPDFQSVDNAQVQVAFQYPDERKVDAVAQPSSQTAGDYETEAVMSDSGVYMATATVAGPDGSAMGIATAGWVYEPEATEMARLGIDEDKLQRLAETSGGSVLSPSQLQSLANWIPTDRVPIKEIRTYPLWHAPWVIGLAIGALMLEWWIRRRYGLA
jgi:hypothetical protein